MDILLVQIGWVVKTMADGSVRVTRTSLNQDVLNFYGVKPKENFLFDLDRGNFYPIRMDAVSIEVYADKPKIDDKGVSEFVDRFI